ncbi:acetolactate synthase large subunit [Endozoicomonas numazuensis]|uniref:Acetolactate synthase n=1 Tax=Endozoicomonas numazuensis TaxID=1137799 RepID=A0A081NEX7_9GAMM|nr:acetolactate synthase large subunit [Endozoicomonas numazuensis]KEQ17000.1 acetolactate synthase [Endozoicomonas numazuensis]
MKASDLFVKCLEEEGIEYIFGVPGEENADFIMSLNQSGKIRFILTRHEQGAAFMAEVYGRLTGHPAGCLGTLGPGATNLLTGVGDGNMDRAPMLVLAGQGSSQRLHKESHQIMDAVSMFRPVTKWSETIRHPDNIPEMIRKAVRLARSEKPGAVFLELCEDIACMDSDASPLTVKRYPRPMPEEESLNQAFEMIRQAKRPVIIAGNGVIRMDASDSLRRFSNLTGIGVISTFMAKGCIDMDDDNCLYTIGLGRKDLVACAVDASDLIITLGYDLVEYHPHLWNPEGNHAILHLDSLPAEVDHCYHPDLELIGDIGHALDALTRKLSTVSFQFDLKQQHAVRRDMTAELEAYRDDDTVGIIRPQKALWDARAVLPADGLLLSDVGAHKMWIARHFHCHEPNTCLIPNGFCSMGFALPGAIAASLLRPDRKVLAISGDGGFMMNVQEMETARRYHCNLTVMVWEDKEYGLIAWKQTDHFGSHTPLSFDNPDWLKLAESFGWQGHKVENSRELETVLSIAMNEDGPSLVVIPIDYRENQILSSRLGDITCPI